MSIVELSIGVGCGLIVGGIVTWILTNTALRKRSQRIIEEAKTEGENLKRERTLEAKEKFLQLKSEHEKEVNARNQKVAAAENRIKQKETSLNQRFEELQRKTKDITIQKENLDKQLEVIERRQEEIEKVHKLQVEKLEAISGMSGEQAKETLIESMKAEARTDAKRRDNLSSLEFTFQRNGGKDHFQQKRKRNI